VTLASRFRFDPPASFGGASGLAGLALLLAWLSPFVSFLVGLGAAPLTDVDEGAFAQATSELLASGNFASTTLLGQPRWDKPILIYWLQALSVQAFGATAFAFRLPSALAAIVWAWLVGAFVARVSDARRGALAVLTLACALGPHVIGRVATADALLNAWLAGAALHAYLFVEDRDRRALRIAAACVGLGLLTKGPIALLVPSAAILLHLAVRRDGAGLRALLGDAWAWLILVGISLPWYAWQFATHGQAFVEGFLLRHNVGRFTETMHGFSAGPFYYLGWTLVALLPSLWLLGPVAMRLIKGPRPSAFTFGLLWCAFVLVFFTFSATKLPHYGFYGLSGLVIAMAIARPERVPRWAFVFPSGLFAIAALWPLVLERLAPRVKDPFYAAAIVDALPRFDEVWVALCAVAAVLVGAMGWVASSRRRSIAAGEVAWALAVVTSTLVLGPGVGARTMSAIQQPLLEAAARASTLRVDIVMWGIDVPSFAVETTRRVVRRTPVPGEVVLTKTSRRAEIERIAAVDEVLFERADVSLLRLALAAAAPAAPAAPPAPAASNPAPAALPAPAAPAATNPALARP